MTLEPDLASVQQEHDVPYSYDQESDPSGLHNPQHGEQDNDVLTLHPRDSDSLFGMVSQII